MGHQVKKNAAKEFFTDDEMILLNEAVVRNNISSEELTSLSDILRSANKERFWAQECVMRKAIKRPYSLFNRAEIWEVAKTNQHRQDIVLLEEASIRQEHPCDESLLFNEVLHKVHSLNETNHRIIIQHQLCNAQRSEHATVWIAELQHVSQLLLNSYYGSLILVSEEMEEDLRKILMSEEFITTKKRAGPEKISWTTRVLGMTVKARSNDKAFAAAWQKMVTLNDSDLDPFRNTEQMLNNFLRTQGLLPGPSITHYPVKVKSSRSWYDITVHDAPEADFTDNSLINTLHEKTPKPQVTLPSINLQTPWSHDTTLAESLGAWTTTWGENVKRNICEVQQMIEIADLSADTLHKHFC